MKKFKKFLIKMAKRMNRRPIVPGSYHRKDKHQCLLSGSFLLKKCLQKKLNSLYYNLFYLLIKHNKN